MLIKKSGVDEKELKSLVEAIGLKLAKVIVPSCRISLRYKFKDVKDNVKKALDQFEIRRKDASKDSIADNLNFIEVALDPVSYTPSYIVNLYDEFISRGHAHIQHMFHIDTFDSVKLFRNQLDREINARINGMKEFQDGKLRCSSDTHLELPQNDLHSGPWVNMNEVLVCTKISIIQL